MCLCNFKLWETFVIKFYFQIIIPRWRTTLGLFWVSEHRSVTAATISHIQLSCCNMKISWLWQMHMQKQSHVLLPNPIRAGHQGIISDGGGYFLQIKAIFVWRSQPRKYKEVKLPGFSIIMSRECEGIFLFKARMGVKSIPICFICRILHSHLYLRQTCDPLCENPAKVFFFYIYNFLQEIILHIVKNILWKYILCILNVDWVRPCQRLKS